MIVVTHVPYLLAYVQSLGDLIYNPKMLIYSLLPWITLESSTTKASSSDHWLHSTKSRHEGSHGFARVANELNRVLNDGVGHSDLMHFAIAHALHHVVNNVVGVATLVTNSIILHSTLATIY